MLMMCPVFRRIISGATARLTRNADFKFVSRTASQFASALLVERAENADPGVVHKNVDGAQLLLGIANQAGNLVFSA